MNSMTALISAVSVAAAVCFYSRIATASPQKIVTVVLENTDYESAITQPFLSQLAKGGTLLTNYSGVGHPSEPNYIAMVGGGTLGVSDDGNYNLPNKSIVDLFEGKNLTWHVYAEDYPSGDCFTGSRSGKYARKHNPLISFTAISQNPTRCANITNETNFLSDFKTGKLPNYTMYVPNMDNDGHDTDVGFADQWMSKTFRSIVDDPVAMKDTLLVTIFDEDEGSGHVYAVIYGPDVKPGVQLSSNYDHVSLLATVEQIFKLGNLGQSDAQAVPIAGFLK